MVCFVENVRNLFFFSFFSWQLRLSRGLPGRGSSCHHPAGPISEWTRESLRSHLSQPASPPNPPAGRTAAQNKAIKRRPIKAPGLALVAPHGDTNEKMSSTGRCALLITSGIFFLSSPSPYFFPLLILVVPLPRRATQLTSFCVHAFLSLRKVLLFFCLFYFCVPHCTNCYTVEICSATPIANYGQRSNNKVIRRGAEPPLAFYAPHRIAAFFN